MNQDSHPLGAYLGWYERRSRWRSLRTMGRSNLVRLSILTPAVGYLILLNQEVVRLISDIDPRLTLLNSDPPWKLIAFYYGTFFLGVGSALYLWKCPGISRKYDSAVEFRNDEFEFFWANNHYSHMENMVRKGYGELQDWQKKLPELSSTNKLLKRVNEEEEAKSRLTELMTCHWHMRNTARISARFVIRALYDLGLMFILVPTTITFIEVSISVGLLLFGGRI